ncbi:MAG: transposase [Bacillota bacterium]|nr:transposase [Bacillota bacterium]
MLFSRVERFFSDIGLSKLLLKCNFYKSSGFSCVLVLKHLFPLIFSGKNLYRALDLKSNDLCFQKNTAYRFLNNGWYNWEKLLVLVMTHLISFIDQLTSKDRQDVLIIDDSLFSRNRSKKVELMAKVYDHTNHKFYRGFRMLTMGWSDGNTFLPLAFQLLSSAKDENVYCPAQTTDKRTLAYKRRENARCHATDVVLDLIRSVRHISAKYVLFDSWFTMPCTVVRIKKEKRDVIGMIKASEKIYYAGLPLSDEHCPVFPCSGFQNRLSGQKGCAVRL